MRTAYGGRRLPLNITTRATCIKIPELTRGVYIRGVCVSEASCPNFEPRAHARLTGLTTPRAKLLPHRDKFLMKIYLN